MQVLLGSVKLVASIDDNGGILYLAANEQHEMRRSPDCNVARCEDYANFLVKPECDDLVGLTQGLQSMGFANTLRKGRFQVVSAARLHTTS